MRTLALWLTLLGMTGCTDTAPPPIQDSYGEKIGSVSLPNSCSDAVQPHLQRALALLHHMTYAGSEKYFGAALAADPDCAIARWGVAMSWLHPLWVDVPDPAGFAEASRLLAEAQALPDKTPREAAYIAAINAYYDTWPLPERDRLAAFERGWREVFETYPDDQEVKDK